MEIEWVNSPGLEHFDVWREGTIARGRVRVRIAHAVAEYNRAPWVGTVETSGADGYINLSVHRATEAEAIADVLDLARRCGMVAE